MARRRTKLISLKSLLRMELDYPGYRAGAGGRGHRKGGRRARSLGMVTELGPGSFGPMRRGKRGRFIRRR